MQLNSLVVKVTSQCNLNCTYCYVFNKGDKSYLKEPNIISNETITTLLNRINTHCSTHDISSFLIIFHGGEPLLCSKEFYKYFITEAKRVAPNVRFDYALQTNGVLLSEEWIKTLDQLNIQIGISLDGTENANIERVFRKNSKPAYNSIIKGIKTVQKHGEQNIHLLSVVNTNEKPINVYNHFKSLNVSSVSFLYPEMNYIHFDMGDKIPEIGDWMISFYKIWDKDLHKNQTIYHPFDTILYKFIGCEDFGDETIGRRENGVLTIKTNGQIEAVDSLKICGNGFTSTNFNVNTNELDSVFSNTLINKYYYAHSDENLAEKCLNCTLLEICGGGQLAHRYSIKNNFNNPSIYCRELKKLYVYMQNAIIDNLPKEIINNTGIQKINIKDELS